MQRDEVVSLRANSQPPGSCKIGSQTVVVVAAVVDNSVIGVDIITESSVIGLFGSLPPSLKLFPYVNLLYSSPLPNRGRWKARTMRKGPLVVGQPQLRKKACHLQSSSPCPPSPTRAHLCQRSSVKVCQNTLPSWAPDTKPGENK